MPQPDSNHARPNALSRPLDDIVWSDDARPTSRRRTVGVTAALVLTGVLGAALAWEGRADAARLADPQCFTHEVTRGDTLSSVARNYDTTLDALMAMNPQLGAPSFNLIYPGDEVAIVCLGDAQPPARVEHVDVERFRNIYEADGVLSWESIIAELYRAGFRGEDLVTMAAIVPGESGRRPAAIGDMHLANATWDGSFGIAQVRALRAQEGTGGPRDAVALRSSVEHQAYGAYEVFKSQNFRAWTVYLKGWHVGHLGTARATAERMGLL